VTAEVAGGKRVTVHEETEYPFREAVRFRIESESSVTFPLVLRIPAWAGGARIAVGGEEIEPEPGTFHRLEREWKSGDTLELTMPMALRTEEREHGAVAVHRGPLVFALKVGEEWKQIGGEVPHADWEIAPTSDWNVGLLLDPGTPQASFDLHESPVTAVPFDTAHPPLVLRGYGKRVPAWGMERNSAAPVPEGPEGTGPKVGVELIPYGSTQLRITEFPVLTE
jgi:hypothetical protein